MLVTRALVALGFVGAMAPRLRDAWATLAKRC